MIKKWFKKVLCLLGICGICGLCNCASSSSVDPWRTSNHLDTPTYAELYVPQQVSRPLYGGDL